MEVVLRPETSLCSQDRYSGFWNTAVAGQATRFARELAIAGASKKYIPLCWTQPQWDNFNSIVTTIWGQPTAAWPTFAPQVLGVSNSWVAQIKNAAADTITLARLNKKSIIKAVIETSYPFGTRPHNAVSHQILLSNSTDAKIAEAVRKRLNSEQVWAEHYFKPHPSAGDLNPQGRVFRRNASEDTFMPVRKRQKTSLEQDWAKSAVTVCDAPTATSRITHGMIAVLSDKTCVPTISPSCS